MSVYVPWTRNEVLDLHILILLIIWMTLDRCGIYFPTKAVWQWLGAKFKKITGWCPQCGWDCDQP